MSKILNTTSQLRELLISRGLASRQIESIVPVLHPKLVANPELVGEVMNAWNFEMTSISRIEHEGTNTVDFIPATASAPKGAGLGFEINMNMIFANEPRLLNFNPNMIGIRKDRILGLGFVNSLAELWRLLYFAPAGYFLQDWTELSKKFYYVEHNVLSWLYDKNEMKKLQVHPMVSNARVSEKSFDHIRARFLFAQRTGYKTLLNKQNVEKAERSIGLRELILDEAPKYIQTIAPNLTHEEYYAFEDLIKNVDDVEEDEDEVIYDKLAELEKLRFDKMYHRDASSEGH